MPTDQGGENLPANDRFSEIISDSDRKVILESPIPLVAEALAGAINSLRGEEKRSIKQRVISLATTGSSVSSQVKIFVSAIDGELPPLGGLHEGTNSDYLAMICGTIAAARDNPKSRSMAIGIADYLSFNRKTAMRGNPQKEDGYQALDVIKLNLLKSISL